jgi:hypothetical protein
VTALEVGLLDSLAWRAGDQLRLALHLPGLEPVAADMPVEVRLRDGQRRVREAGTITPASAGGGYLVEVSVLGRRVAEGLWRIAVRIGEAEAFTPVEARLLVRRGHPVALLPGPEPRTRMAEPPARASTPAAAPGADVARRVVRGVRSRLARR